MKNIAIKLIALMLVVASISCSNDNEQTKLKPNQFEITGKVAGLDSTKFLGIYLRDDNGIGKSDTIFVKEDGSFQFIGEISKPQLIFFWPLGLKRLYKLGSSKAVRFQALVTPGDHVTFTGEVSDFVDSYPSGTSASDDLASINKVLYPIMVQSSAFNRQLRSFRDPDTWKYKDENDPNLKAILDSIEGLETKMNDLKKDFVKAHPKSQAAVWYLSDMMVRSQVTDDEAVEFFENFDQKSLDGYSFYEDVKLRVKAINEMKVGNVIENFSTKNVLDDSDFNLTDLRGKYVLIDFWGLWCGPCRAEMPTVKEFYQKHNDKLAVVGVNNGDSKEKIVDFVKSKGYDWIQLMDKGYGQNLVMKFNVQGFPTKVVLDPEGKLVFRSTGSGEESFQKLEELLK